MNNDDYTPTTEEVERHWTDVGFAGDQSSFRRWLNTRDKKIHERGYNRGYLDANREWQLAGNGEGML
jgi:hypothetical protein